LVLLLRCVAKGAAEQPAPDTKLTLEMRASTASKIYALSTYRPRKGTIRPYARGFLSEISSCRVGDPGRNNGPGHMWNVGNLFNLAGQTAGLQLSASGDKVTISRVTYVSSPTQSLASSLTGNGLISGQVIYFGHGGSAIIPVNGTPTKYSALFVGQDPVSDENLTARNVGALSNSMFGPNVTFTLNNCHAAMGGTTSIAQSVANQLRRRVYAYTVGMFFSVDPHARVPNGNPPNHTPVYMRAWGGSNPQAFDPQ